MLIRSKSSEHWHEPDTTEFDSEIALQTLIERSPTLLPGVEDKAAAVATELAVPKVGAADVVVVDGDGGITIVECKLAANAEIRRWVIGQVFAYAAGLWHLSYEDLERAFEARKKGLASSFDGVAGWEASTFREAVETNLEQGDFRLVIAVDEITEELKRTVLYINRHTTAELRLLALELRYAVDGGVEILLPEIYGEESATEPEKRPRVTEWDEARLIDGIRAAQPAELADRLIRLYEALRDEGARLSWGKGATPSVTIWLGEPDHPVSVSLYAVEVNVVAVNFDFVRDRRSSADMARLAALLRAVPGVSPYLEGLEEEGPGKKAWGMHRGMNPARVLASDEALDAFKHAILEGAKPPAA